MSLVSCLAQSVSLPFMLLYPCPDTFLYFPALPTIYNFPLSFSVLYTSPAYILLFPHPPSLTTLLHSNIPLWSPDRPDPWQQIQSNFGPGCEMRACWHQARRAVQLPVGSWTHSLGKKAQLKPPASGSPRSPEWTKGTPESPYHFPPGSWSFFIHLRNYAVSPWAVSWLWCTDYRVRRVSSPTLQWLLPYRSHYRFPSVSIPHFIFCLSSFSDLLYVSSDSRIYSEGTVALFTGTPALHVCWKQLHIEDNSTGTELLLHVKATSGSVHLTESQPTFCNTGTMKIVAFFWLKQKFSKVRTKGQV